MKAAARYSVTSLSTIPTWEAATFESGFFSEGSLKFTVPGVSRGVSYYCDYFAETLIDTAGLAGSYECFRANGTFYEYGEWSAFRQ